MAVRVVLFERATLILKRAHGPLEAVHHFQAQGRDGVEQQLDRAIRRLAGTLRDVAVRVEVIADGQPFETDFTIRRGRFDNVRRSMAEALVEQAIARRSEALLEKAELLDGVRREFCYRRR
jgi:hypothetical protein